MSSFRKNSPQSHLIEIMVEFFQSSAKSTENVRMRYGIATQMAFQNAENRISQETREAIADIDMHYRTAATMARDDFRTLLMATIWHTKITPPHERIALSIPLFIIAPFNPAPGDGTLGLIFLTTGTVGVCKNLKDKITGVSKQRKNQKLLEILSPLSDRTQRNGHISVKKSQYCHSQIYTIK